MNDLEYADDMALIADSIGTLEEVLSTLHIPHGAVYQYQEDQDPSYLSIKFPNRYTQKRIHINFYDTCRSVDQIAKQPS